MLAGYPGVRRFTSLTEKSEGGSYNHPCGALLLHLTFLAH
jgi:hypothetical protein